MIREIVGIFYRIGKDPILTQMSGRCLEASGFDGRLSASSRDSYENEMPTIKGKWLSIPDTVGCKLGIGSNSSGVKMYPTKRRVAFRYMPKQ
jgi:hypothetical protein